MKYVAPKPINGKTYEENFEMLANSVASFVNDEVINLLEAFKDKLEQIQSEIKKGVETGKINLDDVI